MKSVWHGRILIKSMYWIEFFSFTSTVCVCGGGGLPKEGESLRLPGAASPYINNCLVPKSTPLQCFFKMTSISHSCFLIYLENKTPQNFLN